MWVYFWPCNKLIFLSLSFLSISLFPPLLKWRLFFSLSLLFFFSSPSTKKKRGIHISTTSLAFLPPLLSSTLLHPPSSPLLLIERKKKGRDKRKDSQSVFKHLIIILTYPNDQTKGIFGTKIFLTAAFLPFSRRPGRLLPRKTKRIFFSLLAYIRNITTFSGEGDIRRYIF